MRIKRIHMHMIKMPLKQPFQNALETVKERESIILQVENTDGLVGYGEVVAFTTPWYTPETVITAKHLIQDVLGPLLLKRESIQHPNEVWTMFSSVRGNEMAKSGLECAVWDLFAKEAGIPLSQYIGGTQQQIKAGVVVGSHDISSVLQQIDMYQLQGYERIKVKIKPGNDYTLLKSIRDRFPSIALMADANSAYSMSDMQLLQSLDEFNLLMIEQPLGVDDIVEHSILQSKLSTPICLDESIVTYHDAWSAVQLNSCKVMNIKIGRVGGLSQALRITQLCQAHQIDVWCGGMIEFGISRAFNIALSTLTAYQIPGDISASSRYWDKDIILPEVKVNNGTITVPTEPGIGYELDRSYLEIVAYETHCLSL